MWTLTPNAVVDIVQGANINQPILQVLGIKKIAGGDSGAPAPGQAAKSDRYRLQLSDGTHKQQSAMLATQLNPLVTEERIQKNGIIRLDKYICNTISNKRIVIILQAEVLSGDVGSVIGNPVQLKEDGTAEAGTASAAVNAPAPAAVAPAPAAAPAVSTPAPVQGMRSVPVPQSAYNSFGARSPPSGANPYARAGTKLTTDSGMNDGVTQPINSLNVYNTRWTICVRVTHKSAIKEWKNERTAGKLFSCDLLDESGEIRATAFNEVADSLYPQLEVGKVYKIEGGKLKPAQKKYSNLKSNYELTFNELTLVTPVSDNGVPRQKFNFKPFDSFSSIECGQGVNAFVDVLAVVTEVNAPSTISIKNTQREVTKREITLMDRGAVVITCTLWDKEAENFEALGGAAGTVIAGKGFKLSDYNGRSLSCSSSSTLVINPDMTEAHDLMGWYQSEGRVAPTTRLAVKQGGGGMGGDMRIFIRDIKENGLGTRDDNKADIFSIKGTVSYINHDKCLYKACPTNDCNKKVIEQPSGDDKYRCEKCSQSFPDFKWRLMLTVTLSDWSGQVWTTCFQETGEALLGASAADLGSLKDLNPPAFQAKINDALFRPWIMKCRAKTETYQDETRVKVTTLNASPVDYKAESQHLINEISKYL